MATRKYKSKYKKYKKSNLTAEEKEERKAEQKARFDNAMRRICDALIKRVETMEASNWKKGWTGGAFSGVPQNLRGRNYRPANSLILLLHTADNDYSMPVYLASGDIKTYGIHINKGESSISIWEKYSKFIDKETNQEIPYKDYKNLTDEEKENYKVENSSRLEHVWNIDQTDLQELKPDYYNKIRKRFNEPEIHSSDGMYINEPLDRMFERNEWVCPVKFDSNSCYYRPSTDEVHLPAKRKFNISDTDEERYKDGMEYYSSALHEMAHSTGHPTRLNRNIQNEFGSTDYAREELVAEMTAASIGSMMGFDPRIQDNNAAYIKGWLQKLREDPQEIKDVLYHVNRASYMIMENVDKQRLALGMEPLLNTNKTEQIDKNTEELEEVSDEMRKMRRENWRKLHPEPEEQQHSDAVAKGFDSDGYMSEKVNDNTMVAEVSDISHKPDLSEYNKVCMEHGAMLADRYESLSNPDNIMKEHYGGLIESHRGIGMPRNASGRSYSPQNALFLQMDTAHNHYKAPVYLSKDELDTLGAEPLPDAKPMSVLYTEWKYKDAEGKPLSESDFQKLPHEEQRAVFANSEKIQCSDHVWNIDQTNLREVAPDKYSDLTIGYDCNRIMARHETPSDSEGLFADVALDELVRDLRDGKVESETLKAHGKEIVAALGDKPAYDASSPVTAYRQGYAYYGKLLRLLAENSAQSVPESKYYVYGQTGDADRRRQVLFASEMTAAMVGSAIGIEKPLSPEAVKESARIVADLRGEGSKEHPGGNYLYVNAKELMNAQAKEIIPVIDEYRRLHFLQPLMERASFMDVTDGSRQAEEKKMAYRLEDNSEGNVLSEPDVRNGKMNPSPGETEEQYIAFEKRIPNMSDEELLGYISADSPDVTKQAHPALGDEYDYRHSGEWEEYVKSYEPVLDGEYSRGGIEGIRAFEDKAWQEWKSGGYASKEDRTRLRAELDACDEFLNSKKVREDVKKEKNTAQKEAKRDGGVSAIKEDSNADTDVASLAKSFMKEDGMSAEEASKNAKNILNSKIEVKMEEKKTKEQAVKEQQSKKEAEQKSQQAEARKEQETKQAVERQKSEKQQQEEKAKKSTEKEHIPPRVVQAALLMGALAAAAKNEDGVWMNAARRQQPTIMGKKYMPEPYNNAVLNLAADKYGYKTGVFVSHDEAEKNNMAVRGGMRSVPVNWTVYDTYVSNSNKSLKISADEYDKLSKENKMLYHESNDYFLNGKVSDEEYGKLPKWNKMLYDANSSDGNNHLLKREISDAEFNKLPKWDKLYFDEEKTDSNTHLVKETLSDAEFNKLPKWNKQAYNARRSEDNSYLFNSLISADLYDKLSKDNKILFHAKSTNGNSYLFNIDQTIMHHSKRADYDKLVDANTIKDGYKDVADLNAAKQLRDYVDNAAKTLGIPIEYDATSHDTVYDRNTKSIKIGELGEKHAIDAARDRVRALVEAIGEPAYLDRKAKMALSDDGDANKYDKLAQEVSTGVIMSKFAVPAVLDEESKSLVPYWERESKENSKFMKHMEYAVNNTVRNIDKLSRGKKVDFSIYRGDKKPSILSEKDNFIARQVSKNADLATKTFVVVRDEKAKTASVILPKGASLEVDNEVPGMRKDRIAKALAKEGFENIHFYNRNGALSLKMKNDDFYDKTVTTANLKQYSLVNERPVKTDSLLRYAETQNIRFVTAYKTDAKKWDLRIVPEHGDEITIHPDNADLTRFFHAKKGIEGDAVRKEIAQKYAIIARHHPEMKTDTLHPHPDKNIDLGRIGNVSIPRNPFNSDVKLMSAIIDNKVHKAPVTVEQYHRMFAMSEHGKGEMTPEDLKAMSDYKTALAGVVFSDFLLGRNLSEGQSAAQSAKQDTEVKAAPEPERHSHRGL